MSGPLPGSTRIIRVLLALLACSAALPGAWAALAPRSFYTTFPGAGHWIALSGPFSEHVARDVGAFYLWFALMFAWAARPPAGRQEAACRRRRAQARRGRRTGQMGPASRGRGGQRARHGAPTPERTRGPNSWAEPMWRQRRRPRPDPMRRKHVCELETIDEADRRTLHWGP